MTSKVGEVIQSANELAVFSMRDFLNTQVSEINSKPELKIPLSELVRMSLLLVILPLMLAVSLASADHCASSVGSKLDVSVQGRKNASEHWMITVDTRRLTSTENQWELAVNVHQERRSCDSSEVEQLVSVTTVHRPVHERGGPPWVSWSSGSFSFLSVVALAFLLAAVAFVFLPLWLKMSEECCSEGELEETNWHIVIPSSLNFYAQKFEMSRDLILISSTSSNTTAVTTTPATTTPAIDTTSKPTTTTPTTTTTTTTKPKSCPHSGYQLFEGFNCYKTYSEEKSWSDAREQCKRDGGDLMVLESERERNEVFPTMLPSVGYWNPWMGVYKPEGEDRWVSVKGEPALSSWWYPGYPHNSAGRKCALANETGLLANTDCADLRPFICEIPL